MYLIQNEGDFLKLEFEGRNAKFSQGPTYENRSKFIFAATARKVSE